MSTPSAILAVILGIVFLGVGIAKLTRQQGIVDNFERWGYSDALLIATGAVEVLAAAMLLVGVVLQSLAITGGLLIVFVLLGALMTHQRANDRIVLWIPPVVLLALDVALLVSLLPEG